MDLKQIMFKELQQSTIMQIKRIVSFLPSATELIYEFGKEDLLFGVTHECKYPDEAKGKLQVISSEIDSEILSSNEINNRTCQLLTEGKNIFNLNEKNLIEANPDLIMSQGICEVCAAYTNQVNRALEILPRKPQIYTMDPHNLKEILLTVTKFGEILQESERADKIRKSLEKHISEITKTIHTEKPKVLAIEWIEPFFTAGHWIPEMIEYAGGTNLISKKEEHSRKISFDEISESDPDIIILMPCGFNVERTIKEYNKILKNNKEWNQLRAIKSKNLFVVDADSFFSKPSIRIITGLQILAKILHPEKFEKVPTPKNSFCCLF